MNISKRLAQHAVLVDLEDLHHDGVINHADPLRKGINHILILCQSAWKIDPLPASNFDPSKLIKSVSLILLFGFQHRG